MVEAFKRAWSVGLGLTFSVALGLGLGLGGCAVSDPAGECRVGADCPSGICDDGVCENAPSTSSASSTGSGSSTSSSSSASTGAGSGGSETCLPDHDGIVTRTEVPLQAGLSAKFLAATDITFATSGTDAGGGKRDWDLAQGFAGDHLSLIETLSVSGLWFEADYPGATYAAKLSESADLLGVFEINADALLLRGVVSPDGGLYKTELTYDPPVTVLAFPLGLHSTFSTSSNVSGYANGVFGVYSEAYESDVDAAGTLATPFGDFDVLRVRTTLTRQVGVLVTTIRSFAFVSECFGTVATVTSQDNETQAEFSSVSELRRLSP